MSQTWTAIRLAALRTVRDPLALLVALAFYAVVASVISTLWRSAAHGHGGTIAGYSAGQLTWYLYVAEAAVTALNPRQIELTGEDIATGAVSVELLRPASVVGLRIATELGRCLPRLALFSVIGGGLAWWAGGAPVRPDGLLLAVPSLLLAVVCNLAAQHAVAAAAFWIRDARSAWFLYQKLVFVLGAMLIPVELLPGWLAATARVLPFTSMAYAPARLAAGHVEPHLLVLQVFWAGVLLVAAAAAFAAGERRLQVVGG